MPATAGRAQRYAERRRDRGPGQRRLQCAAGTFADFAGLNAALTRGGFFDARSFTARQGDLVVGGGVKARQVSIATDGGQLTVNGTIDASGRRPARSGCRRPRADAGSGRGARCARHGAAGGQLRAADRGEEPRPCRVHRGRRHLSLQPGATIDLSTPDGVAHGDIVLNARRTGETSGDIAINASGPLAIKGANSLALNAFWTYDLPGGSAQATLDLRRRQHGLHPRRARQCRARFAHGGPVGPGRRLPPAAGRRDRLQRRSFHLGRYRLRPGIATERADRDPASATYGAGEPMAPMVRAGGNLTIGGSLSDGFQAGASVAPTFAAIPRLPCPPIRFTSARRASCCGAWYPAISRR